MLMGWTTSNHQTQRSRAAPTKKLFGSLPGGDPAECERLDKAGKGALLRREGLYTSGG
jgi:hypothetical protein